MGELLVFNGPAPQVDHALRWAVALAGRTGDRLVVSNVDARLAAGIDGVERERTIDARRCELAAVVAAAGCPEATVEVLDGELPQVLVQRSMEATPSWVVVGPHRATSAGGIRAHETADHLIHHLSQPVVVVNEGVTWRTGPVLIGLDGSKANATALEVAAALAGACGRELVGVHVHDELADSFPHPEPGWRYPHEEEVRAQLREHAGADARLELVGGHPVAALDRLASEVDALAIVVGTRGRGGFRGLVAGRVPVQLARHATSAVVVVPHAAHGR